MKSKLYHFSLYAIYYLLAIYLVYHTFSGERGLIALAKLNHEHAKLHTDLENIRADRIEFEHKVSLMRQDSLDLDLLDQQARALLGFANKEEKVVLKPNTE